MNSNIEYALSVLEQEFKDNPYVKGYPFGNAGASRKIYDCIVACVKGGKAQSECKDLILNIFKKNQINTNPTPLTAGEHLNIAIDSIYRFLERANINI